MAKQSQAVPKLSRSQALPRVPDMLALLLMLPEWAYPQMFQMPEMSSEIL